MKTNDYHYELCDRYVRDFNLPIGIKTHPVYFFYEVDLYESAYKSRTIWDELVKLINDKYSGEPSLYLEDYYSIRDKAINYILDSEEYKKFNEDASAYRTWKDLNYPKAKCNGAYNQELINSNFISVDMKNANFQVMQYLGVIKEKTYFDFLKRFASEETADFLKDAKYMRQVIFGKCNPNRQIALEKKLMLDIYKMVSDIYQSELIHFGADEFVIRVNNDDEPDLVANYINEKIYNVSELYINVNPYYLAGYEYKSVHYDGTEHKIGEIYHRGCDNPGKFKCMPTPYAKILTKIMSDKLVDTIDTIIEHNKCLASILSPIKVEKLKK